MVFLKHAAKACYKIGKGAVAGAPLAYVCLKATKDCIRDIAKEDIPSIACKIAFFACVPSLTVVTGVGAFCTPETLKNVKTVAKVVGNVCALPYTGPATLIDTALSPLETALFGETCPVHPKGVAVF